MTTYTTKQGDTWDSISHNILGDCKYTNLLMEANTQYLNICIFTSDIVLVIPDIDKNTLANTLPPWKRVLG
ncbi:MAG: tail protein X [Clostridia bacterium]|nr:tail protein X [Clostridia bacterium]